MTPCVHGPPSPCCTATVNATGKESESLSVSSFLMYLFLCTLRGEWKTVSPARDSDLPMEGLWGMQKDQPLQGGMQVSTETAA